MAALCRDRGVRYTVLGSGFNTLVLDGGIEGVVVQLHALRSIERARNGAVRAGAGCTHTRITRFCADRGRSGLEFAVGIPGTVGGWLAMNAGVPDREMKDVVERIEWLDVASGEVQELGIEQLRFRYRALELPEGAIVLSGTFRTEADDPDEIRAQMRVLLDRRRDTQPIDRLSCGSVFKNPPGDHAGRLIEAAGLKGAREGNAEISSVHANFIVNRSGASASDVLRLVERARSEVQRQFGVELEPEVRIVGAAS